MLYCSIAAIFFGALLCFFTLIYCVTWMLAEVISTCESFTEYSTRPHQYNYEVPTVFGEKVLHVSAC